MNNFFEKFDNLKGAKFISVNGYRSESTGEVSNFVINVNVKVGNLKKNDLNKLKSIGDLELKEINKTQNIPLDVLQTALTKITASAEKNLSEKLEDRSNQSKAQTDHYYHINRTMKFHRLTHDFYVTGLRISKKVIIPGTYKQVNSRLLTIAQNNIKKYANLSMVNYRSFKLGNIDNFRMNGETLEVFCK